MKAALIPIPIDTLAPYINLLKRSLPNKSVPRRWENEGGRTEIVKFCAEGSKGEKSGAPNEIMEKAPTMTNPILPDELFHNADSMVLNLVNFNLRQV